MSEFKFPSEVIELPSKGLLYPKDHPLASGEIEIKYMTTKEEDILANQSYIDKGIVLDKLLESVIITEGVNPKDLVIGDSNAVYVATRILGYGSKYKFTYRGKEVTVDLTELENKDFDSSTLVEGKNEFSFTLPHTQTAITFRILNGHDEVKIRQEIKGLQKLSPNSSADLTVRLKHIITSVNGETDSKSIREFVDNYLLARDARELRKYMAEVQPDIDMTYTLDSEEEVTVPIGLSFFWPDIWYSSPI